MFDKNMSTFTAWGEVVHQEAKKVVELQEEKLVFELRIIYNVK